MPTAVPGQGMRPTASFMPPVELVTAAGLDAGGVRAAGTAGPGPGPRRIARTYP